MHLELLKTDMWIEVGSVNGINRTSRGIPLFVDTVVSKNDCLSLRAILILAGRLSGGHIDASQTLYCASLTFFSLFP